MTTLSEIITRAYRENQTIDATTSTPSTLQVSEALAILQGIIERNMLQIPDQEIYVGAAPTVQAGARERDFTPYAQTYALPHNVTVKCALASPTTLLMPSNPGDGARLTVIDIGQNFATHNLTLTGNGATVDGAATSVLSTNGQKVEFLYRRDTSNWLLITTLTESSDMPFPAEYDDMFVVELAMRIDPRYSRSLPEITATLYERMRRRFEARYRVRQSSTSPDMLLERPFPGRVGGQTASGGLWS